MALMDAFKELNWIKKIIVAVWYVLALCRDMHLEKEGKMEMIAGERKKLVNVVNFIIDDKIKGITHTI
jgi:hypothetical protein